MSKDELRIGDFARLVGRSAATVRRWDRTGRLPARRTPAGQRYYTMDDVRIALNGPAGAEVITAAYIRPALIRGSVAADDIAQQRQALDAFARAEGITVDHWLVDNTDSLSVERAGLEWIIEQIVIQRHTLQILAVTADRLSRFGFDILKQFVEASGGRVLLVRPGAVWSPDEAAAETQRALDASAASAALTAIDFSLPHTSSTIEDPR